MVKEKEDKWDRNGGECEMREKGRVLATQRRWKWNNNSGQ